MCVLSHCPQGSPTPLYIVILWVCWYGIKWHSSPSHSAFYYRLNMLDHGMVSCMNQVAVIDKSGPLSPFATKLTMNWIEHTSDHLHSFFTQQHSSLVKVDDNDPLSISRPQGHCEREGDFDTPTNYRVHRRLLDDGAGSSIHTTRRKRRTSDIIP